MSDPVVEAVLAALAKVKHLPRERISLDSTLAELGMDSLDAVTMLFEIEDRLQIAIPDEAARSVRSVREMVEAIRRLNVGATAKRAQATE